MSRTRTIAAIASRSPATDESTTIWPWPCARIAPARGTSTDTAPVKFVAKIDEPALKEDPTSSQKAEQLPTYNSYSGEGDVTAPLVYVNNGDVEDYRELERLGISVKGAIVIAAIVAAVAVSACRREVHEPMKLGADTPVAEKVAR